MRNFRIWSGPVYGSILCFMILNMRKDYDLNFPINLIALVIFRIGVCFRPSFSEGNYETNRKKHGKYMLSSFACKCLIDFYYFTFKETAWISNLQNMYIN